MSGPIPVFVLLSRIAGVLSSAAAVIHFGVVGDHAEDPVLVAGFALMGAAQLTVAAALLRRPATPTGVAAIAVNGAILVIWLMSRTVGLVVVPGAEHRTGVGVADAIATLLAVGVVASLAARRRAEHHDLPVSLVRRTVGGVALVAVTLSGVAVAAPHRHAEDHPRPAGGHPGHSHHHDGVRARP